MNQLVVELQCGHKGHFNNDKCGKCQLKEAKSLESIYRSDSLRPYNLSLVPTSSFPQKFQPLMEVLKEELAGIKVELLKNAAGDLVVVLQSLRKKWHIRRSKYKKVIETGKMSTEELNTLVNEICKYRELANELYKKHNKDPVRFIFSEEYRTTRYDSAFNKVKHNKTVVFGVPIGSLGMLAGSALLAVLL